MPFMPFSWANPQYLLVGPSTLHITCIGLALLGEVIFTFKNRKV